MTDEGLSHVKDSTSGQLIPEELDIKNLLSGDRVFNSFDEALNNNKYGFHITQIPPSKMARLNKEDYVDYYIQEMNLSEDQKLLLQELEGKPVLLPDNYVRRKYEYDPRDGGIPNPHICDPDTLVFRDKIHDSCYLCNDLVLTMNKYRTAQDRYKWYGTNARFSHDCFLYLFDSANI